MKKGNCGSGKVVIAGAGPAGSSLAIRLAKAGRDVCLIERARFPRHKLCGEFLSPECLGQFRELGVLGSIESAGGDLVRKTVFYSMKGGSAEFPSEWFGARGGAALGLSRAEMDHRLLEAAKRAGAEILEGTAVSGAVVEKGRLSAVEVRTDSGGREILEGEVFVDATGRQRVLSRYVNRENRLSRSRNSPLVGFKAHYSGVEMDPGRCEIYFFPGGYGGLNFVEGGIANHCFLMSSKKAREFGGDADAIVSSLIVQNPRARRTLGPAKREMDWLAVAVDGFGARDLDLLPNLFAVGDSAAFIDPFTGSGMLMALESSELLAEALMSEDPGSAAELYARSHTEKFRGRLRLCSVMRRLSFDPRFASLAVSAAGFSSGFRRMIAGATRKGVSENALSPQK